MRFDARLVTGFGKNEHITLVLHDNLQCLPVEQWVKFRTVVLAFYCLRGACPDYFRGVCMPLLAFLGNELRVPLNKVTCTSQLSRSRTVLGMRSFRVAAPIVWSSLPTHLQPPAISRRQSQAVPESTCSRRPTNARSI
jgi:hypothetical protein